MGWLSTNKATPPDVPPKVKKEHCEACNGRGSLQSTELEINRKTCETRWVTKDVRCRPCNGQGWVAW